MAKIISKVNVTSIFRDWWQSNLSDIFANPDDITIISAIEYNGGLYLIYTYEDNVIPA